MDQGIAFIKTVAKLQSQEMEMVDENGNSKGKMIFEKGTPGANISIIGTFPTKLKWFNIISITLFHLLAVWSLIMFPYFQNLRLFLWAVLMGHLSGLGVTGGAHRLWTHRSYKAKLPLRIFMMLCFTLAGQNSLFEWIRDHRVHHKFTETDADPHNSKRGFFFAHVGWLMMKKHPEVIRRGNEVDMSDVLADPVVQFHERHFILLKLLVAFVIPTCIPPLCWNQDWFWSFMAVSIARYVVTLNFTWSVNSAAHIWGNKPYDKNIKPAENLAVAIMALGEGWHNYHHTFPWDYKTSELGKYSVNATALWLDCFAKIGWAYDMKMASNELIEKVAKNKGDGSHLQWGHDEVPDNDDNVSYNYKQS